MKALTIYQPWASLIMVGAKECEFRKWDYRTRQRDLAGQRIVIHAGARPIKPAEIEDIFERIADNESALDHDLAVPLLNRLREAHKCRGVLELAAGLGTAVIGEPARAIDLFADTVNDSSRIDHSMWAWPLTDIERFDEPVPVRGAQGFWNWRD